MQPSSLSGIDILGFSVLREDSDGQDPNLRGVTPHQLTPDVWAQIGGKWVLFGHGGREMAPPIWVYTCTGVLLIEAYSQWTLHTSHKSTHCRWICLLLCLKIGSLAFGRDLRSEK